MTRTWIVIDGNASCWRAHHSTGSLSHDGKPTGVFFGFLRDIANLEAEFGSRHFAFCFDGNDYLRKKILPSYKMKNDPIDSNEYKSVRTQIRELRDSILPRLGYRNVFCRDGYEADDLICSVVNHLGGGEKAVIVSSDKDLFQLLGPGVIIYRPREKETVTEESFLFRWKVQPGYWPTVKAIAGCVTDKVPGVEGVAEITAVKYLRGELPHHTIAYKAIDRFLKTPDMERNMKLVRLPFPGTPSCKAVVHPAVAEDDWNNVCCQYGLSSLTRYSSVQRRQ